VDPEAWAQSAAYMAFLAYYVWLLVRTLATRRAVAGTRKGLRQTPLVLWLCVAGIVCQCAQLVVQVLQWLVVGADYQTFKVAGSLLNGLSISLMVMIGLCLVFLLSQFTNAAASTPSTARLIALWSFWLALCTLATVLTILRSPLLSVVILAVTVLIGGRLVWLMRKLVRLIEHAAGSLRTSPELVQALERDKRFVLQMLLFLAASTVLRITSALLVKKSRLASQGRSAQYVLFKAAQSLYYPLSAYFLRHVEEWIRGPKRQADPRKKNVVKGAAVAPECAAVAPAGG
jgi:hypothetical protein